MTYRVAMDIGGTFTDFVVVDEGRQLTSTGKTSTTPASPEQGRARGSRAGRPELPEISFIVHGTTVGLNAFLERKGTRVLLVMTAGPAGRLLDRASRPEGALHAPLPQAGAPGAAPRRLRGQRAAALGRERRHALRRGEPRAGHRRGQSRGHRGGRRLPGARLREPRARAPGARGARARVPGPVGDAVARDRARVARVRARLDGRAERLRRAARRAATSAISRPSSPRAASKATAARDAVERRHHDGARRRAEQPVQTLLSGPVGGTIGGAALSRAIDRPNLLCVDMGGTSFDLSLIVDGRPTVSTETELEGLADPDAARRHPHDRRGRRLARVARGGRPARRTAERGGDARPGLLRPRRHGADGHRREPLPRPARPGVLPRRADAARRGGGRESRSPGRRRSSGSRTTAFAEGMLAIINAKMADAMRTITVKQGIDPRDYSLVAFGGAGPMHAVWLAEELEIGEVIVPWSPGTFSAWGMLQTDMRHDVVQSFYRPLAELEGQVTSATVAHRAAGRGRRAARSRGHRRRRPLLRSLGRHALRRPGVHGERADRRAIVDLARLDATFHDAHRVRYGHSTPGAPVEFVNLRLAGFGRIARRRGSLPGPGRRARPGGGHAPRDVRRRSQSTRPCCTAIGSGRATRSRGRW